MIENGSKLETMIDMLNRATPLLTYQVVKYGVLLFERNHNERMIFEVNTIKVYFDLQPMYRLFDRLLAKQIKEEGLGQRRRHANLLEAARRVQKRLERAAES